MTLIERTTTFTANDLENHAISIAAAEWALEADDRIQRNRRFDVAHQIRRWEEGYTHDGIHSSALDTLTKKAGVQGAAYPALYALRREFQRMAALYK